MGKTQTQVLQYDNNLYLSQLSGPRNAHLKKLEHLLDVEIGIKGNELHISGPPQDVKTCIQILDALWDRLEQEQSIDITDVDSAIRFINHYGDNDEEHDGSEEFSKNTNEIRTKKINIKPRSPKQAEYIQAMRENDMVFGLGPAGTGKTYLAVALGVEMYLSGEVERLVFCRPAVEAGERLGFLPGDMKEKIDPYLRPIYDALNDVLPADKIEKKLEAGDIEIAPLAFMRGRTLHRSFVILDEAQNAIPSQMKMFLTRMGEGSHMVITGDPLQSDLPERQPSGLTEAMAYLNHINEIKFVTFTENDVVRHQLVSKIIEAYEHRKS